MPETNAPEIQFDISRARPIFPRPALKHAVLVKIPRSADGAQLPTYILPEWGTTQMFLGSYYGIVQDGIVVYGSAQAQWEAMHHLVRPGYWVKTAIPLAYQASSPGRIVTLIQDVAGGIQEANYVFQPGDWIVRQPGGEIQHIKATKYGRIYFTAAEAATLGLDQMTPEDFAAWAIQSVNVNTSA